MEILLFVVGLFIGSFLNVCIYRIPKEESVVFPPSHCPGCNTRLKPLDLIPIISYLIYRGRCRYCKEHISIRYPIIEAVNGALYLILYIRFGFTLSFGAYALLSSILLTVSLIDYDHQIIPDGAVILGLITAIVYKSLAVFLGGSSFQLLNSLTGLIIGGGFFLLVAILSNGGMGGGDIKLMGMLGFWFGWQGILLLMFLSFIIGGILSVLLLAFKIKTRKEAIPFGPFIAIAAFITINYSQELIYFYLNHTIQLL